MKKCKYCKWEKVDFIYISTCTNQNCQYCDEECVEQDKYEAQDCDDKEER